MKQQRTLKINNQENLTLTEINETATNTKNKQPGEFLYICEKIVFYESLV
jgi:hypothetical protein